LTVVGETKTTYNEPLPAAYSWLARPAKAQVVVTESTEFIGRHLVPRLLAKGDRVRCLIRCQQPPEQFAGLAIHYVQGDVAHHQAPDAIVAGCEVVYHLAAVN
jgi:dihydroflavonol-4-reductase